MAAYDFMGLVYTFSQHTEQSDYYSLLVSALSGLNDQSLDSSVVQCWFYMNILEIFGSNINTESPISNADGQKTFSESALYDFSYDDMSFFEHPSGSFRPSHIKLLRLIARSSEPSRLKTIVGVEDLAADIAQTLKTAASMHKA
jgi:hypothetical protein